MTLCAVFDDLKIDLQRWACMANAGDEMTFELVSG